MIGGKGISVQLNELKFEKRKYNHGHHVDGIWHFVECRIYPNDNSFYSIQNEILKT